MSLALVQPTEGHLIDVTGAAHPGTVIALYRTISAAVDSGHRAVVIDLSAVTSLRAPRPPDCFAARCECWSAAA